MKILIYIALFCVIFFFVRRFLNKFKFNKCGAVALFTGGIKAGKSGVSLAFAISTYKRVRRAWKFRCVLIRFFNKFRRKKKDLPEEPFLYSTIKLRGIKYCPLRREHLLRVERLHFGSVCFIDEASLVADSMLYKDAYLNGQLLLFFKLYGHMTHGGKLIVNTHCIGDLHFALRRVVSEYFYVHHISRYIPFFTLAYLREERYSEDNTFNTYSEDVEDSLKRVLMRKKVFKYYDKFCFSALTDNLKTDKLSDLVYFTRNDSLKMDNVVSFNPVFYNLGRKEENV